MQICLDIDKSTQNSFKELGIEPMEAVKSFFSYIKEVKELPFKIPNDETIEAIKEAENGINVEEIDFNDLVNEAKSKIVK